MTLLLIHCIHPKNNNQTVPINYSRDQFKASYPMACCQFRPIYGSPGMQMKSTESPSKGKPTRVPPAVVKLSLLARRAMSLSSLAWSTRSWTILNRACRLKTIHKTVNHRMVHTNMLCHPSVAKTRLKHANSLPSFRYTEFSPNHYFSSNYAQS